MERVMISIVKSEKLLMIKLDVSRKMSMCNFWISKFMQTGESGHRTMEHIFFSKMHPPYNNLYACMTLVQQVAKFANRFMNLSNMHIDVCHVDVFCLCDR